MTEGLGPGMHYVQSDNILTNRMFAGKTGTTNDMKNALFAGFSANSSTVVLYYNDYKDPQTGAIQEKSLSGVAGYTNFYGYTVPLYTWAYYNDVVQKELPNEPIDLGKPKETSSSTTKTKESSSDNSSSDNSSSDNSSSDGDRSKDFTDINNRTDF
jgi:membrane peptidoglycan carboxypeptidase